MINYNGLSNEDLLRLNNQFALASTRVPEKLSNSIGHF